MTQTGRGGVTHSTLGASSDGGKRETDNDNADIDTDPNPVIHAV